MKQEFRDALEPFGEHYLSMSQMIRSLPDDELSVLRDACDFVSSTNCAWYEYRVAQAIKGEVSSQLHEREKFRRAVTAVLT